MHPFGDLISDSAGNLFGVTGYSALGNIPSGAVFKVTPAGKRSVLFTFTTASGYASWGGFIRDSAGNLFGTGSAGGRYGYGTVFKISPAGAETTLYSFHGYDGSSPNPHLARDRAGNFFGTTSVGGAYNDGVVFELTPNGTETVLHNFSGAPDGKDPINGLTGDGAGNFYGTTTYGGAFGSEFTGGTVFKITGTAESILYSFGCSNDGCRPFSQLKLDDVGNVYGVAEGGSDGLGVVFLISPSGQESVLHAFGTFSGDGADPYGIIRDRKGNIYGATLSGGDAAGDGTVFKISPNGTETVLFSGFSWPTAQLPLSRVLLDSSGQFFGTTLYGGSGKALGGTLFRLTI